MLVVSAVGAHSIRSSLSPTRAKCADSTDPTKPRKADTSLGARIILFIGSTFLSTNTKLVSIVSILAIAVPGIGVIN